MKNDIKRFRDGIIDVNTRQFGRVAEVIVKILRDLLESGDLKFDLIEEMTSNKIEVKASKVLRANKLKIDESNFYDVIIKNSNRDRLLATTDIDTKKFDCNIQQIKAKLFDKLVYLLFFKDAVEIFEVDCDAIVADPSILYVDKQHRGNIGEGQFHVNNKTYPHHKQNYFVRAVTYEELVNEAKRSGQSGKGMTKREKTAKG